MYRIIILITALSLALIAQPSLASESPKFAEEYSVSDSDKAIRDMASIVFFMEHYVVSNDKKLLKAFTKNEKLSQNVRTIAEAIVNIQHKPLYSDIEKLQAIFRSEKSNVSEQELAYIISNFRYKPSAKDKSTLKGIIK